MSVSDEPISGHAVIDAAMQAWRQGDCVLGEEWILVRGNPDQNTPVPDVDEIIEESAAGLVVVTQTCDIVRSSEDRPFVEVSPLVKVSPEFLTDIKAGRRPGYAYIPSLAEQHLVADLERTMTITKNLLASWDRTPGCSNDKETRDFSRALMRKRGRFAFPDDFNHLASKLVKRLKDKHDKRTNEGDALRRLDEIRVTASAGWDAPSIEIFFWFIRKKDDALEDWSIHLDAWLGLIQANGRFASVDGVVCTLEDMTAADYINSDLLDLDHLSRTQ